MKKVIIIAVLFVALPSFAQNRKYDDYKEKVDSLQQAMVAVLEYSNSTIPAMYYHMRDIQDQTQKRVYPTFGTRLDRGLSIQEQIQSGFFAMYNEESYA